ncbi:hypothetical protein BDV39DRAFT_38200 [Aspergillus sergii]|uniref:Linalool dehydratase/isomerase domain-containing protein n=1 Tax=Aspergillus sergii TaxID=1034303 RepID=A0A5N6WJ16_9EURO|nr:hypothetical protein BDV39DRAFT_38200 [Aspergillus sergii]
MDKNAFTAASRIPEGAGKNPVTAARIKSTVNFYKALVVLALASFLLSGNPRLQNAALAILFPGEAFVGLGGLWLIGLPVTLYASTNTPQIQNSLLISNDRLLFALSLFLWFATGNIIAPFVTWPGLALLVPSLPAAGSTTSHGVYTVTGLAALAYYSLTRWANKLRATTVARRETRNAVLPKVIAELQEQTKQTPTPRDLELDPELLGRLRYLIQVSLQDQDDFKNFDTVEQFQPSAIRYQITEMVYALAFANRFYTPSFRCGYLHEGQKGLLKKYCQEKVLWYWKYEALWGALV